jgi:hypothetical protein
MTQIMTEKQIERIVERRIDRIDKQWTIEKWSQYEYDQRIAEVDAWAESQYTKLVKAL